MKQASLTAHYMQNLFSS